MNRTKEQWADWYVVASNAYEAMEDIAELWTRIEGLEAERDAAAIREQEAWIQVRQAQAMQDAIAWNCQIALDPTVSSDAQALINRGAVESRAEIEAKVLEEAAKETGHCWRCKADDTLNGMAADRRVSKPSAPNIEQASEVERDAARYRWLHNEHMRFDPICHLSWKRNWDRNSSYWVNTDDLDKSIDAAIGAAREGE